MVVVVVVLVLLLLLFLAFNVLVANPRKLLYTVANPARGLLKRENRTKKTFGSALPLTPHPDRSEKINNNNLTHRQALRRSLSASLPYKDSFDSSTRSKGVASQNSTLLGAITSFPVSLLPSSPGDV